VLRAAADDIILSANAAEAERWLPGVRVVRDIRPERGSLVALHTALSAAAGGDILVVAWDMPFVTAPLLSALRARLMPGTSAVVPESARGLEPFCAAYAGSALATVERAIAGGDLRVTRMIHALPRVTRLGAHDLGGHGAMERLFFNVNTVADLVAAERMAREG
jgi:molybdopterin-guanine dinucleotide biosynthesis protein A